MRNDVAVKFVTMYDILVILKSVKKSGFKQDSHYLYWVKTNYSYI